MSDKVSFTSNTTTDGVVMTALLLRGWPAA